MRPLDTDEWRELREVRLAALRDAPEAFARTYAEEAAFDDEVWRERATTGHTFLARDEDARAVGLATGIRRPEGPEHTRELVGMWVAPRARGQRIADALVAAVAEWARACGAAELGLWVVEENTVARRAYERAGLVATGERKPVVPGDPRIESRMVLAL